MYHQQTAQSGFEQTDQAVLRLVWLYIMDILSNTHRGVSQSFHRWVSHIGLGVCVWTALTEAECCWAHAT